MQDSFFFRLSMELREEGYAELHALLEVSWLRSSKSYKMSAVFFSKNGLLPVYVSMSREVSEKKTMWFPSQNESFPGLKKKTWIAWNIG